MQIGIFGGSFNPIHCGHIQLARNILEQAKLDQIWFVVSPQNPLKQNHTLLDDNIRFDLVRKALEGESGMYACDYEFHLPRPSYMWNTLQNLGIDYPQHQFTLLIGGDNWTCFNQWYHHEDILKNYNLIIYPRSNSLFTETTLPANVKLVQTELLDISSTEIRTRIKEGESIKGMVPACITEDVSALYI